MSLINIKGWRHRTDIKAGDIVIAMCGRFSQSSTPQEYAALFGIDTTLEVAPSYNIAPGHAILACRLDENGAKTLSTLHWGMIPSWSRGPDNYSLVVIPPEVWNGFKW